ncbi:MAG: hypothetical protein M3416_00075 [Acidobacteriota bacterium]|nr:hypothetical protein [Acidobacteriota bacterium]
MNATLMTHKGARKVTRQELSDVQTPPATDTFKPVPHATVIDELETALAFRHIKVARDEYAISPDGMRLFSLLELDAEYEGVRFAIGLRNANDKSMRLGMVAGYRVFVCDNMALSGDFKPLLARHTKHFNLIDSLSMGVDRIQRGFEPLREAIDFKRGYQLNDELARSIIYRAFLEKRFPLKLLKVVHKEFFLAPSHEEFRQQTVWSLENAFTTSFKELKPDKQYEMTAKLGTFLQPYAQAF